MTLASDLANSYTIYDGVEDVTFTSRSAGAQASVKAKRRTTSRRDIEFAGNAGLGPLDTVWHLWVSTMGGKTAQVDDTITVSATEIYTIREAVLNGPATRYRCLTARQR